MLFFGVCGRKAGLYAKLTTVYIGMLLYVQFFGRLYPPPLKFFYNPSRFLKGNGANTSEPTGKQFLCLHVAFLHFKPILKFVMHMRICSLSFFPPHQKDIPCTTSWQLHHFQLLVSYYLKAEKGTCSTGASLVHIALM